MSPDVALATAVHEAGHVVAFFSIAGDVGFPPNIIVEYVDLKYTTAGHAVTVGEFWSAEIKAVEDAAQSRSLSPERVVEAALAGGADVRGWAEAEIRKYVAGAAAEAKFRSRHPETVLLEPGCDDDHSKIICVANLAGLTSDERHGAIMGGFEHLDALWSDPHEWSALLKLAHELHTFGQLDGSTCWKIYQQALGSSGPASASSK